MLKWALWLLLLSGLATVFGFGGALPPTKDVARLLFLLGLLLFGVIVLLALASIVVRARHSDPTRPARAPRQVGREP